MSLTLKAILLVLGIQGLTVLVGIAYLNQRDKDTLRNLFSNKVQLSTQLLGERLGPLICKNQGSQAKVILDGLRENQSLEFARVTSGSTIVTSTSSATPINLNLIDSFSQTDEFEKNSVFLTFSEMLPCSANAQAGEIVVGYNYRELDRILKNQLLNQFQVFVIESLVLASLIYLSGKMLMKHLTLILNELAKLGSDDPPHFSSTDANNEFFQMQQAITGLSHTLNEKQKEVESAKLHLISKIKFSSLDELSAGIVGQIQNPLNVLTSMSHQLLQMIKKTDIKKEVVQRHLTIVNDQAAKIESIVKNLSHFSQSGNNFFQNVRLKSIFSEALDYSSQKLANKKVIFKLDLTSPEVRLECRPHDIALVISELIDNACEAVQGENDKWITAQVKDLGDQVAISVTDSGNGIAPEIRNHIMRPFFTTKPIDKSKKPSIGLNKAVEIATQHQGSLVYDESSKNTRFILKLPKIQPIYSKFSGSKRISNPIRKSA